MYNKDINRNYSNSVASAFTNQGSLQVNMVDLNYSHLCVECRSRLKQDRPCVSLTTTEDLTNLKVILKSTCCSVLTMTITAWSDSGEAEGSNSSAVQKVSNLIFDGIYCLK